MVLRYTHDYTNYFNTKWNKNQFGGRKVVGQTTMVAHWAKSGQQLLPSMRLRHQSCRQEAVIEAVSVTARIKMSCQ